MTPTITSEQRQAIINERRIAKNTINNQQRYIGLVGYRANTRQHDALKHACIALSNLARIERDYCINWQCYGHPIPVTWLSVLQGTTCYRLAFERPNKATYSIDGYQLVKCDECGQWELASSCITIDDEHTYCSHRCAVRAGWHSCDACGEWTRYGQLDYSGNFVCDDCSTDYVVCYSCGDLVHDDDARAFSDEWYCPSCYETETYDLIHEYGYNDYISKHGDACDGPYMGVELEVDDGNCQPVELAADLVEHCNTNLFWMTRDGSLNNGVEIASQPMTLAYHTASGFWADITGRCLQHGYRSHDAGTCGLHIHIDRDYFIDQGVSDEHAGYYLTLLSQRFERELTRFSRRRNNGWCEYFNGTDWTDHDYDYLSLDQKAADCCANYDHSIAVNMEHSATFELRIFRGTLKLSTLIASLALTDGLARYVATHNEADCFAVSWRELCQWILDHCPVTDARANLRDYLISKRLYNADVHTA